MKILGLDTATHKCGYALFHDDELIDSGVWKLKGDLDMRLAQLLSYLTEFCATELPDLVALEVPFVHPRMRKDTAIRLGEAVGVVKGWAFSHGVSTLDVYPSQAKRAVSGSGKATKHGVQEAVKWRFGIEAEEDQADAIAVAMAALHSG